MHTQEEVNAAVERIFEDVRANRHHELKSNERSKMRTLIEIIRMWNRQWELYEKDRTRPKPLNVDEFAAELDSKFTLEEIDGDEV